MNLKLQKDTIKEMYEMVLNNKRFADADLYINKDYVEQFLEQNRKFFSAFPDIRFDLKEVYEDKESIITYYTWKGMHLGEYQGIAPTKKIIEVEGVSFYFFKNSKIVRSVAKPDKYSFFSQLGVIPQIIPTTDLSSSLNLNGLLSTRTGMLSISV